MSKIPLRWFAGDRARWRGITCTVEYVAEDAVLISYRIPEEGQGLKHAIVSLPELDLNLPNGDGRV